MLKKFSWPIIITIVIITGVSVYNILQVRFNYDFESFFPKDDEDLEFFEKHRSRFENDSDYLLLGIERSPNIYDLEFLKKVHTLTNKLKQIKYVKKVISPTNYKLMSDRGGWKLIKLNSQADIDIARKNIPNYEDVVGSIIAADEKALCLFIKLDSLNPFQGDTLMTSIDSLMAATPIPNMRIAGRLKAEKYYVSKMMWELVIFISSSFFLIIFFLWRSFRSAWGVVVPLIVVLLAVVWSIGLMGMLGKPIDLLTVLLPSIMFVVGMSDVVHIIAKYLEELRDGKNIPEALKITFREIGRATLLTSITTAIGFATLITARIRPIQEFGIFTALGVMLAFVLAFSLLPAILVNLPKPKLAKLDPTKLFWHKVLHGAFLKILKARKVIGIGAIVVTILSVIGISLISINVSLIDEVNDGDPLKEDFKFMEAHFSGARPFELSLTLKDTTKSFFDKDILVELEKTENYLRESYGLKLVYSPLTMVRMGNRALFGGGVNPEFFVVPEQPERLSKISKQLEKLKKYSATNAIVAIDGKSARFTGRMPDVGSAEMELKNEEFYKNISSDLIEYKITGSALLLDKNNNYLSKTMINGLLIAFGIIAIIMGILFKSLKMIVISLIPNILPLMMIGGYIGFMDIGLKVSTSIIFTIAFGIAVDDTIHFMSKLKIELMKGRSLIYAIKRTFISTGKAIIITSMILVSGFLTLMFSSFNGTFYTGLLISMTLFFAVLADLLLIPVLLILFSKKVK